MPLMSLVTAGHAEGRLDVSLWPDEMVLALRPDVIVFQRYLEDGQVEAMQRLRKALPDALFIYELDDYLGEVPQASFHAGFMPPGLPEKIARASAACDRVTTSTGPLADWFRDELHHPDVRVVPNAIPAVAVRPRQARPDGGRLRIGFVGGISHAGDLELIRPAMAEIGDAVEWVFFGMQPKDPPVRVEFHPGVQPSEYQARMLGLDIDLILAPLEDNRFNRCKSNLRLVEGGMVGACVIAQDLDPYVDDKPPVFALANSPEEWTKAIRTFVDAPAETRQQSADRLQQWVLATHTLEGVLPRRIDVWLRKDKAPVWRAKPVANRLEDVVLALPKMAGDAPRPVRNAARRDSLIWACRTAKSTGADVLWLRPGTLIDADSWTILRRTLSQGDNVAAAIPIASDGPNAFPRDGHWTPMSEKAVTAAAKALRDTASGRRLGVAAPSGPCVLLSARALAAIGIPDPEGCDGNEEQALMEWGFRAAMRGMRTMQAGDAFASTPMPPTPPTHKAAQRMQLRGYAQGGFTGESFSSRERVEAELAFLRSQWTGPIPGTMGFGHDYASWSALRGDLPDQKSVHEPVVEVRRFGTDNPTWTERGWVVFIDDNVHWKPNGLATLDAACAAAPKNVVVVYGDNEFIDTKEGVYPDFKPDFDLELFLARDYVTPVCAIRITNAMSRHVADRAALYALLLNAAERFGSDAFLHIPKALVSVREHASPEEAAVTAISRQMAIEKHYGEAVQVRGNPALPGTLAVRRNWRLSGQTDAEAPLVSIIIPTLGSGRLIQPCVNTIRQHTRYPNYEILVVQNGPRAEPELGDAVNDPRVRVVHWTPSEGEAFSWSRLNNEVARGYAKGDYLCFVNDDVAACSENWLDAMMGHAVRAGVGAVGARLLHPAGMVQHVGVICHKGIAGHLHKGLPNGQPGNGWLAMLTHEATAVTGACMLVSRANFESVAGFDAYTFPMNYSDTDFCLRLCKLGMRNIVEMGAEFLHPEGTSRTDPADQASMLHQLQTDNTRFATRWSDDDRYWHPALALGLSQGGLAISGLNRDLLAWDERIVRNDAPRVLLVNDAPGLAGQAVSRMRLGEVVLAADLSGFTLRMTAPIPANVAGWDVRDPKTLAADLALLGVSRIVLRSLVGGQGPAAPVEALRCFAAMNGSAMKDGFQVDVDPLDPSVLTPWASSQGRPLDVFGSVDTTAWRAAYNELAPEMTEEAAD